MDLDLASDPTLAAFRDLAIAGFIGALIGTERQRHLGEDGPRTLGGLRTFVLFAELGALSAWLAEHYDQPAIFLVALAAVAALVVAGFLVDVKRGDTTPGLTTEVAALITVLAGAAVVGGEPAVPAALAVVLTLLLALKEPLHRLVERIGQKDILAGLQLLFAALIVLPLLPDEPMDPWGAIEPRALGWLVILIAGLQLVGYIAMRWLGARRGVVLTGLTGGLVSSTAVTLALSRQAKQRPELGSTTAMGILVAWVVMQLRVLIEVAVVDARLLRWVAPVVGTMAVAALLPVGLAWWKERRQRGDPEGQPELPIENPFSLVGALRFGLLFAAVLLAVEMAETHLPQAGVYAVSALAGTTNVDAITLSMAGKAQDLGHSTAARAIVLSIAWNTVVKAGMALVLGSRTLLLPIGLSTGCTLLVAGAWWLLAA